MSQRRHVFYFDCYRISAVGDLWLLEGWVTLGTMREDGGGVSWYIVTPSGEVLGTHPAPPEHRYYLKDRLGSVRVVLDGSGNVVETRDHYPFIPLRSISRPAASCGPEMPRPQLRLGHEDAGELHGSLTSTRCTDH